MSRIYFPKNYLTYRAKVKVCTIEPIHIYIYIYIQLCIYIYIYIYISSSCRSISNVIPDPLLPALTIVHCFHQVFRTTSRIGTEQLYVGSSWSSCLSSSIWRGPQEYITNDLLPTSPAMSSISGSSNFDSFRIGWYVVVQLLLLCGVLQPGLVQYCSQYFCVVAVKLF